MVKLERKLRCVRSTHHDWFEPGKVYTSSASNIGGVDLDACVVQGENCKSILQMAGELTHKSCGREFAFEPAYPC